jgi:hypothetical protein
MKLFDSTSANASADIATMAKRRATAGIRLDTGPGLYGLPVGLPGEIPVEILTCRSRLPAATGP